MKLMSFDFHLDKEKMKRYSHRDFRYVCRVANVKYRRINQWDDPEQFGMLAIDSFGNYIVIREKDGKLVKFNPKKWSPVVHHGGKIELWKQKWYKETKNAKT